MNTMEPLYNISDKLPIKQRIIDHIKYIKKNCKDYTVQKISLINKTVQRTPYNALKQSNYTKESQSLFLDKYHEKLQFLVNMCSQPYNLNMEKLRKMIKLEKIPRKTLSLCQLCPESQFREALTHFSTRNELLYNFFSFMHADIDIYQLTIENNIDDQYFPNNFIYITECILGTCERYWVEHFGCKSCCSQPGTESTNSAKCCCLVRKKKIMSQNIDENASQDHCCQALVSGFYGEFAYDEKGLMRLPERSAIYECNHNCACQEELCGNRIVQKNSIPKLTVFKTTGGKGWALRSNEFIAKGRYITKYVGEYLEESQVAERESNAKYNSSYILSNDFFSKDSTNNAYENFPLIDAYKYGNESRFINHSCDPNAALFCVWTKNYHMGMPEMAFFAKRNIPAGKEITFNYQNDYFINQSQSYDSQLPLEQPDTSSEFITCQCDSKLCKKVRFRVFPEPK
ncbi:MAG: hypothetical protein MHMPM18_001928 [Marteilia pararefringens]